jgi:hypothetical protein
MKNIHVLRTEKPSNLFLGVKTNKLYIKPIGDIGIPQHIYITSDEEIKEGDWYYLPRTNSVYKCVEDPTELNLERRLGVAKIILTTDQDLIKNGVQKIDDEFLEWFVKNPSCEEIKVADYGNVLFDDKVFHMYKIIIPKEEPKQETLEKELITDDSEITPDYFQPKSHIESIFEILDKKQETLEEAAKRISRVLYGKDEKGNKIVYYYAGFIEGAKWQQERMYNEEDMIEFGFSTYCYISELMGVPFNLMSENKLHAMYNFEQFKKKVK